MIKIEHRISSTLKDRYFNHIDSKFSLAHAAFSKEQEAKEFATFIQDNFKDIVTAEFKSLLEIAQELYTKFPILLETFSSKTFFYSHRSTARKIIAKINQCNLKEKSAKDSFLTTLNILKLDLYTIANDTQSYYLPTLLKDLEKEIITPQKNIADRKTKEDNESPQSKSKQLALAICKFINGDYIPLILPEWVAQVPNIFAWTKQDSALLTEIIEELDIKVCPLCNKKEIEVIKDHHSGEKYRPAMDHFLPKSRHPVFSLSLYNLIPCCETCNSTFKKDKETYNPQYLNPYESGTGDKALFRMKYLIHEHLHNTNVGGKNKITLKTKDKNLTRNIKMLKLEPVYNTETTINEVKKILNQFNTFKEFKKHLPADLATFENCKKNIFCFDENANLHHIPHGKLKYDLIKLLEMDAINTSDNSDS